MPSTKTIFPLIGGSYYHIFNRGINSQRIFFTEDNYRYFLKLLDKYLNGYIEIIAYCLLPNHFHLVIKAHDSLNSEKSNIDEDIGRKISKQFRSMFIAYSLAINKQENRTGSLFEKNFKRIEINEHEYLQYLIFYVHNNPEKHGLISNFRTYTYSSFQTYLSKGKTRLSRQLGLEIFNDKQSFLSFHDAFHPEKDDEILE
jgi:putative transposase